jgi:hypothetical protein
MNLYKTKSKYKRKYSAVTLIEVLLYIALTSTMLVTITASYNNFLTSKVRTSVRNEVDTQALFIIEKINYELRNADQVITPTNTNSGTSLEFHIQGAAQNSVLGISGGNIQITNNGVTTTLSNNIVDISNFNVENRAPIGTQPAIHYSFTISTTGAAIEFNYSNDYQSSALLKLY